MDNTESISSVELARALLGAWVEGRFRELDGILQLCVTSASETRDSGEEERLELVAELTERAKAAPSFQPCAWMRLVMHLAAVPTTPVPEVVESRWPAAAQAGLIRLETLVIH